jgi:putative ABC transport system substrate-binding protein
VDAIRRALTALLAVLTLALLAAPLAVGAQQGGKVYTLGFLSLGSASGGVSRPFRDALHQLGYVEGRNLVIEARFADADVAKLPDLAADLVRRRVDVIVTIGTPPVKAAKNATTTIPIVMAGSGDPVEHGLVASLARPGANVTGVAHTPGPDISGKGLQLLKEAVPTITRVAVLWDSSTIHEKLSLDAQQIAARALGVTLLPHDVQTLDDLQRALAAISQERADGLFIFPNFINDKHGTVIVDFAMTHRLATMLQETWWVEHGGLMSYYSNWDRLRERAAVFVDISKYVGLVKSSRVPA